MSPTTVIIFQFICFFRPIPPGPDCAHNILKHSMLFLSDCMSGYQNSERLFLLIIRICDLKCMVISCWIPPQSMNDMILLDLFRLLFSFLFDRNEWPCFVSLVKCIVLILIEHRYQSYKFELHCLSLVNWALLIRKKRIKRIDVISHLDLCKQCR